MSDQTPQTNDKFSQFSSPAQSLPFERMKEIRLCGPLSEVDDSIVPVGHYYSVDFNVERGQKPVIEDLGEEITVNVLRHAMQLKKWDSNERQFSYDSTEFRTFFDPVVLYDRMMRPPTIVAALPYTHKKEGLPMMGGKGEKSLKQRLGLSLKYITYVLYKDEVYRMGITVTDNSGADEGDAPMSFGDESPDSFTGCKNDCAASEPDNMFLFDVKLGCKKHSKKIYLKTFTKDKRIPKAKEDVVLDALNALYKQLSEQMWNKYAKAREATPEANLDKWTLMVLANIDRESTEALLYSDNEKIKADADSLKGEVIDVKVIEAPKDDMDSVVGDLEGSKDFPPSKEDMEKHNKKKEVVAPKKLL